MSEFGVLPGKIQKDPRGKDLFCKKININQNKNQG
jgi:hypothetical protein